VGGGGEKLTFGGDKHLNDGKGGWEYYNPTLGKGEQWEKNPQR